MQYFCVLPYISTQSILHPFSFLLTLQFLSFSLLSTFLQPPLTICFLLRIMKCYQNAVGPRYTNKCTQRNLNLGTNEKAVGVENISALPSDLRPNHWQCCHPLEFVDRTYLKKSIVLTEDYLIYHCTALHNKIVIDQFHLAVVVSGSSFCVFEHRKALIHSVF